MDWRLVFSGTVIRQCQGRAGVAKFGAPVKFNGQVGRGRTGGARGRGRGVGVGGVESLQARRDGRGGKRIGTTESGRAQARGGRCREGKGGIGVVFGGGQHQVLRPVLPGRLAGNPPFLLGRRGEGELLVQLKECRIDAGEGARWRRWAGKKRKEVEEVVLVCKDMQQWTERTDDDGSDR